MATTFGQDIQTLDNVDFFRVATGDKQEAAVLIGGFRAFNEDYKKLSSEIEAIPRPNDRANVNRWIDLFHERGMYLDTAETKMSAGTIEGQLDAISAFNRYKEKERDIEIEGKMLGINSCP